MKYFNIILSVMILSVTGCSRQILVTRDGGDQIKREINDYGARKSGIVLLNEGKELRTKKLNVKNDSLFLEIKNSDEILQVPLENVRQVTFRNSGRGALQGMGLGALAGGSFGIFIGLANGDDPPGWFSMTGREKAVAGGIAFGALGGISGLIIGAITGSPDRYIFSPETNTQNDSEANINELAAIKINKIH